MTQRHRFAAVIVAGRALSLSLYVRVYVELHSTDPACTDVARYG